ncbi:helix-turn-helix domain-containing protein [Psychromonas hadalis]|uniref:helix-turn-helix domain-containing protein n=1 Tax=Psychromonas hadalis TaxID=211669 RepID=UPI0003B77C4C|nr:helix-turn-helix domain-containing protein [Psychromonas hadalis]
MPISRTKTSFYRRLLLAHFIDNGINTVPKIMDEIEIPRRTAQDSIVSLKDLDIVCSFKGALKDGEYIIESWGGISKSWVSDNVDNMKRQLGY